MRGVVVGVGTCSLQLFYTCVYWTSAGRRPANILIGAVNGDVRITGFGIASYLPRERQAPDPPENISGTLAYTAPEQTGRMNRSIDSRSDLYSLGVVLYRMLTGVR